MPGNNHILVVEDDPQVAEILHWNLRGAGYDVTVVRDGVDALLAFDAERPALITVDLNLPRVSGFRLVKLLKRYAPDVPVIVVTALAFEEAEETAEAGADDFITKPFDPQDLVQKIAYHLDRNHPSQPTLPLLLPAASSRDRASMPVG